MEQMSKKEFNKIVASMRETNERMKILHEIRTERAKYSNKEDKKKIKTSNIVLCCSIIAIVLYTVVCMII